MSSSANRPHLRALTIAGFDPSGGAGVLADARTFSAFGFDAIAAITSITFQNSQVVHGAVHQNPESVRSQVESMLEEGTIACAKTGMLPTRDLVREVARLFRETGLPLPVVDPVMVSSSGYALIQDDAIESLIREVFPIARLLTPNIPEAERLTGLSINSESDMETAATRIRKLGARAVLIKGGHLDDTRSEAVDVLDDDGVVTHFRELRIPNAQLHGSGCILSSAIAAGLGRGQSLVESVAEAKSFVLRSLRDAVD